MNKTKKIIIAVLSAVLVLSAAFSAMSSSEKFIKLLKGGVSTSEAASIDSYSPVSFNTDYPLVQTEQKDLFYEANPDGSFRFYKFADGTFTEVKDGIKTKNVTLSCSYQNVKFKLYYLSTDAGTVGYGLFNSQQKSDTKLFSYIFVRLMDCPAAYAKAAKTDYILLLDMDAEDAYKTDKTYSDMYSYNMQSDKTSLVISQRDRLVQEDGTMREDWTIFNDSMLNAGQKYDIFASCRTQDTKAENKIYDFLTVANSRAAKKNSAATLKNSPSYIVREKDGAYFCFVNTEGGFDLIKNGDKKNPLKSFDGSFGNYIVSGDNILSKSDFEMTDITSGETISLKKAYSDGLSSFIVNEDRSEVVIFCTEENQSVIICDTLANEAVGINDAAVNQTIGNSCFIDGQSVLFSSYDEAGAAINTVIKL